MKRVLLGLVVVAGLCVGCLDDGEPKSDQLIQRQQEAAMRESVAQTGLPAISNFQEKKMLKLLYELRDREDLVCHAYLVNQINGAVGQYLGKCIGYGLPASTQYSNPEKEVFRHYQGGIGTLPQAEPNGLFMPEGLSATWRRVQRTLLTLDSSSWAWTFTRQPERYWVRLSMVLAYSLKMAWLQLFLGFPSRTASHLIPLRL